MSTAPFYVGNRTTYDSIPVALPDWMGNGVELSTRVFFFMQMDKANFLSDAKKTSRWLLRQNEVALFETKTDL